MAVCNPCAERLSRRHRLRDLPHRRDPAWWRSLLILKALNAVAYGVRIPVAENLHE